MSCENFKKRQVKTPKVYLRDTGLLHSLLNIPGMSELWGTRDLVHRGKDSLWNRYWQFCRLKMFTSGQPRVGLSLICFFSQAESDFGVECKFNEAPKVTKSMHSALEDLSLDHLWVVYPGTVRYPVHEKITMLPLAEVSSLPQVIL